MGKEIVARKLVEIVAYLFWRLSPAGADRPTRVPNGQQLGGIRRNGGQRGTFDEVKHGNSQNLCHHAGQPISVILQNARMTDTWFQTVLRDRYSESVQILYPKGPERSALPFRHVPKQSTNGHTIAQTAGEILRASVPGCQHRYDLCVLPIRPSEPRFVLRNEPPGRARH